MIFRSLLVLIAAMVSLQALAQTENAAKDAATAQSESTAATANSQDADMPPTPFAEDNLRTMPLSSAQTYRLNEEGPLISLERAHQLAKKNNPNFHNVDEQVYQSETLIRSAWAMLLPNLSAEAKLIRNQHEVSMGFPDFENMSIDAIAAGEEIPMTQITIQEKWQKALGFSANITLFNARSIPLIQNAYDSVDQAKLEAQVARNDLLFAVTSAYYQIANLKELIFVYAENVATAEEALRMAEARKMVGQGTRIDVMRAQIQMKDSQRTLDDAVDAYETAKRSLALMLGIKGDFRLVLPNKITGRDQTETELTKSAMEDRIELKTAEMDVVMAKRYLQETRTKWIPTFDATWKVDMSSTGGFSGEKTNWMLIFAANWSILEGGARFAEMDKRKSQIRMAQNRIEALKLEIQTDVAQKYHQKISKERNVEVSGELVDLAQENYDMVSKQYEVGMANSLELTDASSDLARKKVQRVLAKLEYELALLTLGNTIGEYNSLALE